MNSEVTYYQYQKELDYPVFVRFEDKDFEHSFSGILSSFGFTKLVFRYMVTFHGTGTILCFVDCETMKTKIFDDSNHWLVFAGKE